MEFKLLRRVDVLGRIVIPKDIRRTLHLQADDDVEITVENNAVVLRKRKEDEEA